jgi:hypothetical protein
LIRVSRFLVFVFLAADIHSPAFMKMLQSSSASRDLVSSCASRPFSGNMVRIAVVWPQEFRKPAINYMTHPIHCAAPVCFIGAGLGVNVPRIDGASTSIGAARPHQSTL